LKTTSITDNYQEQTGVIKKLDYFFVLRPMLFFPGWSTLLAGFLINSKSEIVSNTDTILQTNYFLIVSVMIIFGAAMGMSFLMNQLKDIESDRRNNKLFIISEGHITRTAVIIEIILLCLIAVLGGFAISFITGWLILVFIVITGYLYNYRPFILKDRPMGSLTANASMGWMAFALGWTLSRTGSSELILDSIPYLFFNTALYLFTLLPDIDGDRETSKKTLAVLLGMHRIIYGAFLFYSVSFVSSILLKDWQIYFVIVLAFPFFLNTIIKKEKSTTLMATKFSILFFAVMICLKIPAYLILMVSVFFLTRWYFRARFNFDYPNFKGT
jgi:1,4-dihydroxy-2-naphthoate octaprenyltransferase